MESESAGPGVAEDGAPLVFVSDASAEAARISVKLGELGYTVADVPLALLAGRVAVQRPSFIVCDADAEGAVEALVRVRELTHDSRLAIIALGERERITLALPEGLADAAFSRPVDVQAMLDAIERLVGLPEPRPKRSSRPPGRPNPSTIPRQSERAARLEGPPPSVVGGAIPLPPDLTGEGPPPKEQPADAPAVELGPDMQELLLEAERRFSASKPSPQVSREDHGPEMDAEGALPPEVLLALEEPLDDEDFSEESQTPVPADGTGTLNAPKLGVRNYTAGTFATSLGTDATAGPISESASNAAAALRPKLERTSERPLAEEAPPDDDARRARQQASTPKPPKPVPEEEEVVAPPLASESDNGMPEPPSRIPGTGDQPIPTSRPKGMPPPPPSQATPDPLADARSRDDRVDFVRRALSSTTPPVRRSEGPAKAEPAPAVPPSAPMAAEQRPASRLDLDVHASERPAESRAVPPTPLGAPTVLRAGDAVVVLAKAIAARYTGALAFEVDEGIRRIVLRDGDLVTVATGVHGESLVAFLASRGDLPAEVARQGHKIPAFGRRAGAALIAHGHLAQDQLWPVLRAHAEWLVGRVLEIERGGVTEEEVGRLAEEPAVFGGATGAEVLVEVVRRAITPEEALQRLGGLDTVLDPGPAHALLGECALAPAEAERVQHASSVTVRELVEASPDPAMCALLYALVCLGVLGAAGARPRASARPPTPIRDELDDEALRARILTRKALVDEGDYFAVLGVSRDATGYDIRRAFTALRRELEPSHVLTARTADLADIVTEIIGVIEEAYQILSDQRRRERYRRAIEAVP
ncbi:MAG TPA: DnaJ domain-containing protein [Polyangiaceae bacterium]|nr:DnaJ domain-containing protein [Polyangiaceae bacterium]